MIPAEKIGFQKYSQNWQLVTWWCFWAKSKVLAQAHFNSRFANPPKRHLRRLRWQEAFGRRERKDHSSVEWALGSCSFSSPQASKRASILLVLILYTDMFLMQLGTWCSTLVIISSDYGLSAGVCMQSFFFEQTCHSWWCSSYTKRWFHNTFIPIRLFSQKQISLLPQKIIARRSHMLVRSAVRCLRVYDSNEKQHFVIIIFWTFLRRAQETQRHSFFGLVAIAPWPFSSNW